MSSSLFMSNNSSRQQHSYGDENNDDEVQRMLTDFEQYFAVDKEAREKKLEYLELRQRKIDESLASIEKKQKIAQYQEEAEQQQNHEQRQEQQKFQQQQRHQEEKEERRRQRKMQLELERERNEQEGEKQKQKSEFLHEKVVQLARALAKMTRERDHLDLELTKSKMELQQQKEQTATTVMTITNAATKLQQHEANKLKKLMLASPNFEDDLESPRRQHQQFQASTSAAVALALSSLDQEKEIWKREIVSLRNALENHVVSDRKDRHSAQQDKEGVLNEVAEELGQVMAQRDLAFVELEKLKRLQDFKKKESLATTVNSSSFSSSPSSFLSPSSSSAKHLLLPAELETAEKQISALQLQLAHARRDVTIQSVNLHVANEKYSSLKEDIEKVCCAFQTTSDQCNGALSILNFAQSQVKQQQQQQQRTNSLNKNKKQQNTDHNNNLVDGFARLTSCQISELMLFISRVRSDFSNISSLLEELKAEENEEEQGEQDGPVMKKLK